MELKEALMTAEVQFGFAKGCGGRTYLALRRGGISTLQQLCSYSPEKLSEIRDIGSRCTELIAACLQLYGTQGPAPPDPAGDGVNSELR